MVCEEMKDRFERWIILPFSMGCTSSSSIAIGGSKEKEKWSCIVKKKKNALEFFVLPKPNISRGLQRFIRSFKKVSHLFVHKDESEEEREEEMEIGFPTDVKHVTHIGWDGSTTTNEVKGWENLSTPEIISFPSISLKQFEVAMASQTHGDLIFPSSKLA